MLELLKKILNRITRNTKTFQGVNRPFTPVGQVPLYRRKSRNGKEIKVCFPKFFPCTYRQYFKLVDLRQRIQTLYSGKTYIKPKIDGVSRQSENILISVHGSQDFDYDRLKEEGYDDLAGCVDKSSCDGRESPSSTDTNTDSSSDSTNKTEFLQEKSYMYFGKTPENLSNTTENENVNHSRKLSTLSSLPINWEQDSISQSFHHDQCTVVTDPFRLLLIEIEDTSLDDQVDSIRSSIKDFNQETIDSDTAIVVDVKHPVVDYQAIKRFVINELRKYFKTDMDFENEVFVSHPKHNISKAVTSSISRRIKREICAIKELLESDKTNYRYNKRLIREVECHLGMVDHESEECMIDEELETELLKLTCVKGICTIDGELQIHLTEGLGNRETVESFLRRNDYDKDFSIVPLKQRAERLHLQQGFKFDACSSGTIGCLLRDRTDKQKGLYALTAAHIFQAETATIENMAYLGHIDKKLNNPIHISIDDQRDFALISIAENLLEVVHKENENLCASKVMEDDTEIDRRRFVYMYGATSGFSRGMLEPSSWRNFFREEMYIIRSLIGTGGDPFARHGDSGAVICQYNPDLNVVVAISLLVTKILANDKNCEEEAQYLTIPLKKILSEYQDQSGIDLELCRMKREPLCFR